MLSIRTVLCSVDFSEATARQVDLAAEICRAFGAQLILHHNRVELAIGSGVGWMWAPGNGQFALTAEQKLRDLVARVPAGTTAEMRLTSGSIADAVLETPPLAERRVDIIPLANHFLACAASGRPTPELDETVRDSIVTG